MIKKLTARGNGWFLNIPKPIIKLLGLNPETSSVQFKIINKILYVKEIFPDNPDFDKYLVRKLSKKNSSRGLYMPNSILELLEINPESDLINIDVEDNVLIVKKNRQI